MNKADKVLIVCLLIIAAIGIGYNISSSKDKAQLLAIECSGNPIKYYKLPAYGTKHITGNIGSLQVQIDGRRVRITDADCPDRLCVNYSWLTNSSGKIVCLPNKVVIKLIGESKLDALVQ